jgi:transposase
MFWMSNLLPLASEEIAAAVFEWQLGLHKTMLAGFLPPIKISVEVPVCIVEPNVFGLETGATSTWLWTELNKMGLPAICIDARHAKAALKLQINKSDRNDAVGIARIMQCGWYKEVRVKDFDSHAI